jgi:hypothetical protein
VKAEIISKLGITYEQLRDCGEKIIELIKDPDAKLFCRVLLSTGLGNAEVRNWVFGNLRAQLEAMEIHGNKSIRIDGTRTKTGAFYTTFLMDDLLERMKIHLKNNKDKDDDDKLFDLKYHNIKRILSRAYDKVVERYFPTWAKVDKQVFTLHTFRAIFISTCETLRVPKSVEDRLVGHKSSLLDMAYSIRGQDLSENFRAVQNELFGVNTKQTEEEIEKRFFDNLRRLMSNNGRLNSQHKKFISLPNKSKATNEMRAAFFLKDFETKTVRKTMELILEDKEYLQKLKLIIIGVEPF